MRQKAWSSTTQQIISPTAKSYAATKPAPPPRASSPLSTSGSYDNRGARLYDAEIARFLGVDPLAQEFAAWSGYNYVLGNPVMLVDPDGRAPQGGGPGPYFSRNPFAYVHEGFRQMFQTAGEAIDGAYISLFGKSETEIVKAETGNVSSTTILEKSFTVEAGSNLGAFFTTAGDGSNQPSGAPFIFSANASTSVKQVTQVSGNVGGVGLKAKETVVQKSNGKTTTSQEVSVSKSASIKLIKGEASASIKTTTSSSSSTITVNASVKGQASTAKIPGTGTKFTIGLKAGIKKEIDD